MKMSTKSTVKKSCCVSLYSTAPTLPNKISCRNSGSEQILQMLRHFKQAMSLTLSWACKKFPASERICNIKTSYWSRTHVYAHLIRCAWHIFNRYARWRLASFQECRLISLRLWASKPSPDLLPTLASVRASCAWEYQRQVRLKLGKLLWPLRLAQSCWVSCQMQSF